ncbi:pleckstrin homology domain-containing family G member 4B-like isoform 3-T5 [Salvelinus alpinus]
MNTESLDGSIQNTLSALFPPFEATAPTVLSQLFQVIEERFRGDALQCLLDFLIPAKHILESVQQAACAQYSDVVFCCEGWPLCLHEKVVIQLAPINPLFLCPGDFYLQVAPFSEQAARIVVRSLLEDGQGQVVEVEETPIPETSYPCIFSEDWLGEINQGRHGTPLSHCVLSTDQGMVKVPWAQVTLPEFVDKPRTMASSSLSPAAVQQEVVAGPGPSLVLPHPAPAYSVETRISPAKHGIAVSLRLVDSNCSRLVKVDQDGPMAKPIGWVSPNTWDSRSNNTSEVEGEYVDLVEFTNKKEALLLSGAHSHKHPRALMSRPVPLNRPGVPLAPALPLSLAQALAPNQPLREPLHCGRTIRSSEEPPCTPCMRRRMGQVSKAQELRCRYRESYHSALQNPVTFERDNTLNTLAVLEEASPCEGRLGLEGKELCPGVSQQCCHPDPGHHDQIPPVSTVTCRESGESYTISSGILQGLSDTIENDGRCPSSLSTTVVDTSEKCEVVIQGRKIRRDIVSSAEKIPSLHVVQCKNATAFGLVSPKMNRRRLPKDVSQARQPSMPVRNGQQTPTPAPLPETTQQPPGHYAVSRSKVQAPDSAEPSTHPLQMGIACLTGGRDRTGRLVVEVYGDQEGWRSPSVSSLELCKLLLYLHSVIRRELRELGLTLVIDARQNLPPSQFNKALLMLQEQIPHAVHSVLILVEKESCHRPEKHPGQQIDVVTSLKALHKLVEGSQLTYGLEGTLLYSHQDWLQLHQKLHPFMSDLQEASGLLLKAIRKLEGGRKIDKVQDVQRCILEQRTLMKDVLEDSRLVALQREGGAMLSRLRRESDLRYSHCEDYSDAVDSVTSMYNHVEEQAHMLVQRSNMSLEHLEYLLQLREMEGHFSKIRQWFDAEGERRLLEAESVDDSKEKVAHTLQSFRAFLSEANEQKHQAMVLVTEAEKIQGPSSYPETEVFRTMVCTFKSGLADSLSRAERCSSELETMVSVCSFCEQATELAKDCRQYLGQEQVGRHPETDDISTLQMYQESFVQFSPDRFQEVKAQACALRGSRGMRVWNVAWLKCQEVRQQLEERLQDVERALRNTGSWYEQHRHGEDQATAQTVTHHDRALLLPRPGPPHWYNPPTGSMVERYHGILESRNNSVTCYNINFKPQNNRPCKGSKATTVPASPCIKSIRRAERDPSRREACRGRSGEAATLADSQTVGCEWFPWKRGGLGRSMSEDSCATAMSSQSEARIQTQSCSHGQPSCRILQAAQKFQISRHGSFCSAVSCSGQERAEKASSRNTSSSVRRCEGTTSLASPEENAGSVMKLQRIMEELLLTEREYVRSLGYILMHYLPLLERTDVPQDLRGKRGVIFGNLEKLYDFHGHFFLRELEACQTEPLGVARCFLRYRESLGLYALYSKNKPQSDALILHHRHDIFKRKQQELGDHMDLSSYLLRPIQRISKYSLLLQDMLGVCGPQRDRDREELQAAADVIRFQMRHGNDLLTMDAIQDCDVNLKEQGQLIRQDEFIVFFRKKKCFRHIFLFQDLILFSKTKKTDVGNDVYIYKQSFKTSDIGMTHNSGESGLCFEIWIRRRKSQDTYTLKADRAEVKRSWTRDLEQILWEQAAYSRDLRMQERVFNGMGRKPFMDIQPSEAAICDRAVNCVLLGRAPVPSCLQTDLEYLRPNSIGSGSSASTSCSHSSSSSGRGSLPPVGYPGNQTQGGEANHIVHSFPATVTEEDLSNHHNHQKQNLHLMGCTDSSGESTSVFISSERSCLSAIGGEVEDSSSVTSQSSQSHVSQRTAAPSLKKNSSPATIRKKPSISPKPPVLAAPQSLQKIKENRRPVLSSQGKEMVAIGKSTEV